MLYVDYISIKLKKNKGSTEEGVGAEGSFMEGELKFEFFFKDE